MGGSSFASSLVFMGLILTTTLIRESFPSSSPIFQISRGLTSQNIKKWEKNNFSTQIGRLILSEIGQPIRGRRWVCFRKESSLQFNWPITAPHLLLRTILKHASHPKFCQSSNPQTVPSLIYQLVMEIIKLMKFVYIVQYENFCDRFMTIKLAFSRKMRLKFEKNQNRASGINQQKSALYLINRDMIFKIKITYKL